ncbi:hypothetical protein SDC9_197197 [bioreactor metagenome]|uniref:Uncharacterized protein n=1 Tax=bioreactor metagenome TaxID=1076179 RepID=A0A645IE50_9ZZZZ
MIHAKLAQVGPVRGFHEILDIVGFAREHVRRLIAADRGGKLGEEFRVRHDGDIDLDVRVDGVKAFHEAGQFLAGGPNGDGAAQRCGIGRWRFRCFGGGRGGIRSGGVRGGGFCGGRAGAGKHSECQNQRKNDSKGLLHGFSPPFIY